MAETTDKTNAPRSPLPGGWRLAVYALTLVVVAACSGGSSKSSDEDANEDQPSTQTQKEPETRREPVAEEAAADDDTDSASDDAGSAAGPAADDNTAADVLDPEALVRRLDRLVAATDARILRSGLAADAATSLSLDRLEERLQSAQARLRGMRPYASDDGARQ